MNTIAIPVMDLVNAKQRLVPLLAAYERRALAAAMLEDVLAALESSRFDGVWVVTRDEAVTAIAQRFGARVGSPESGTLALAQRLRAAPGDAAPGRFVEFHGIAGG